ncbi:MAG: hypothetical protein AAFQ63_09015 [Cyanobacteria bacterium J06621_11]
MTVDDDPTWSKLNDVDSGLTTYGIEPGHKVRYTGGNLARSRVCGRKKLTVVSFNEGGYAVVNHKSWQITQTIDPSELEIVN